MGRKVREVDHTLYFRYAIGFFEDIGVQLFIIYIYRYIRLTSICIIIPGDRIFSFKPFLSICPGAGLSLYLYILRPSRHCQIPVTISNWVLFHFVFDTTAYLIKQFKSCYFLLSQFLGCWKKKRMPITTFLIKFFLHFRIMKATTKLCTESKEGKVDWHSFDFALVVTKQWQQDKESDVLLSLRKDWTLLHFFYWICSIKTVCSMYQFYSKAYLLTIGNVVFHNLETS